MRPTETARNSETRSRPKSCRPRKSTRRERKRRKREKGGEKNDSRKPNPLPALSDPIEAGLLCWCCCCRPCYSPPPTSSIPPLTFSFETARVVHTSRVRITSLDESRERQKSAREGPELSGDGEKRSVWHRECPESRRPLGFMINGLAPARAASSVRVRQQRGCVRRTRAASRDAGSGGRVRR